MIFLLSFVPGLLRNNGDWQCIGVSSAISDNIRENASGGPMAGELPVHKSYFNVSNPYRVPGSVPLPHVP